MRMAVSNRSCPTAPNRLSVYYMLKMVADSQSFSPSSLKPLYLAERLVKCKNVQLKDFEPATFAHLIMSHVPTYVDDILNLRIENGFGNKSAPIRDSLLYTVGAEIAAALHVARQGGLAWALCSGFHHATRTAAGGFCTFDGLSIAGRAVQREMKADIRILIVDGDAHYGNGTVDCIHDDETFEYATYNTRVKNSLVAPDLIERIDRFKPDIILFQDGLDAYKFDPLSEDGLSYKELADRTAEICRIAQQAKTPLVINLAGGYTRCHHPSVENELEPVLTGHLNAIKVSAEIYGVAMPEIEFAFDGIWEREAVNAE